MEDFDGNGYFEGAYIDWKWLPYDMAHRDMYGATRDIDDKQRYISRTTIGAVDWSEVDQRVFPDIYGATTRCYQLNTSAALRSVKLSGRSEAIIVRLDLAVWNNTYLWNSFANPSGNVANITPPATIGVSLDFTSPDDVPSPQSRGYVCGVGSSCTFGMTEGRYSRMGGPSGNDKWGNCTSKKPYSVLDCQMTCLRAHADRECNALGLSTLAQKLKCEQMVTTIHASDCVENPPSGQTPCFPPCEETSYDITQSQSNFNPVEYLRTPHSLQKFNDWLQMQWYRQVAVNGSTETNRGVIAETGVYPSFVDERGQKIVLNCALSANCSYFEVSKYLAQNTLEVTIFPVTLQQNHYTEAPSVSVDSFTATLGGNMGLFLGISGMTVFEWLEFSVIATGVYCLGFSIIPGCHELKNAPQAEEGEEQLELDPSAMEMEMATKTDNPAGGTTIQL